MTDLGQFRSLFETHGVDISLASKAARATCGWAPGLEWGPGADLFARFFTETLESQAASITWTVDLDRKFAALQWVLTRISSDPVATELVHDSVMGASLFEIDLDGRHTTASGGQGFAVRFSTADRCKQIAGFLSDVSPSDIGATVDVEQMEQDAVYKVFARDKPDELAGYLENYLTNLSDFYIDVAERDHSVVICRD